MIATFARPARRALALGLWLLLLPTPAGAQELNPADTAWLLTATAMVLFMTLPGLALFYAGLVQPKNVLSVLLHCFAIACLVSVAWLVAGYSLAFTDGGGANALIGGLERFLLLGLSADALSGSLPESVFLMFQMTFAIITPALIVGAYVERIRFSAVLLFSLLWLLVVYAPVAHWVWGGGWLAQRGVMDFAGGLVVHTTAGVAAVAIALRLGARTGYPEQIKPPHSPILTMIGACMLWVGWFGFNAGSALQSGTSAGMALLVTHLSAAVASLVWLAIEWLKFGKPSIVGMVTGMVAGLATVTPASGFVGPWGGVILGLAGGLLCYGGVVLVRNRLRIDDSLDVFAVHGVGGMTGTLLAPILALAAFGGPGLAEGASLGGRILVQIAGILATAVWTAVATVVLALIVQALVGLRVSPQEELEGLDITAHGERGYHTTTQ